MRTILFVATLLPTLACGQPLPRCDAPETQKAFQAIGREAIRTDLSRAFKRLSYQLTASTNENTSLLLLAAQMSGRYSQLPDLPDTTTMLMVVKGDTLHTTVGAERQRLELRIFDLVFTLTNMQEKVITNFDTQNVAEWRSCTSTITATEPHYAARTSEWLSTELLTFRTLPHPPTFDYVWWRSTAKDAKPSLRYREDWYTAQ
jgi:hypothetical protein